MNRPISFHAAGLAPALILAVITLLAGPAPAQFSDEPIERPEFEMPYRAAVAIYSEEVAFLNPLLESTYRGGDARLAMVGSREITESDLWLFLTLCRHPKPYIFDEYRKARTPLERAKLGRDLRQAIRLLAVVRQLAEEGRAPSTAWEKQDAEIMALSGYELAFTEAVLEKTFSVTPADAFQAYRTEPYEFYHPAEATLRMIVHPMNLPAPPTLDELAAMPLEDRFIALDEWQGIRADGILAAEREMNALRERIVAGAITFEEAARTTSKAPSASNGGLVPAARAEELAPSLSALVFDQPERIGQVSPPVVVGNAMIMVKVESRRAEGYLSLEEAMPKAMEKARIKALNFAIDRELHDVAPWCVLADARTIDKIELTDPVVEGPGFTLTKGTMLALHPELQRRGAFYLDKDAAHIMAKSIGARVHIRRLAREEGLDNHPYVSRAKGMADMIVQARAAARERIAPHLSSGRDAAMEYMKDNPTAFTPSRRLDAVAFKIAYPDQSSPERGQQMAREVLDDLVGRAQPLLRDDMAERSMRRPPRPVATPAPTPMPAVVIDAETSEPIEIVVADAAPTPVPTPVYPGDPAQEGVYNLFRADKRTKIVNLARDYQYDDLRVEVIELGFVHPTELAPYEFLAYGTPKGSFTKVHLGDDEAVVFLFLDEETIAPQPAEKQAVFAADELALTNRVFLMSSIWDAMTGPDKLKFTF